MKQRYFHLAFHQVRQQPFQPALQLVFQISFQLALPLVARLSSHLAVQLTFQLSGPLAFQLASLPAFHRDSLLLETSHLSSPDAELSRLASPDVGASPTRKSMLKSRHCCLEKFQLLLCSNLEFQVRRYRSSSELDAL